MKSACMDNCCVTPIGVNSRMSVFRVRHLLEGKEMVQHSIFPEHHAEVIVYNEIMVIIL